jgi:hypothetical protein
MKARSSNAPAFSLIEVVMALGVVSFALVVLLALSSSGLVLQGKTDHITRASETASSLFAVRRFSPTAPIADWPIKPLTDYSAALQTQSGFIDDTGRITSSAEKAAFRYRLRASYDADTRAGFFDLLLWWPARRQSPEGAEQLRMVTMIANP